MSEDYKDHGHPPGWENEHDPRCQACALSELASSGCSAFAWESMTNGGKLLLLTYALMAVVARTWTETWRQADWPHELSLSTERDAFRRLTDRQNAKAVPAAAGGSESTQEPSPPLGTSA